MLQEDEKYYLSITARRGVAYLSRVPPRGRDVCPVDCKLHLPPARHHDSSSYPPSVKLQYFDIIEFVMKDFIEVFQFHDPFDFN